ncbi:hypothetical protein BHF71_02320 [Vulcanibacillus modesticaldus]|uniref:Hut operon positive regulatory protein n=1 Tax=Vulcanibacillus modesticaldus TaxID=337097 RepID=A0A1D2YTL2_9BACI|nr:hut operon transcriptional regulator HutP [Vulcanibacillus modesticaldus]OEF99042.1 hypothetical protein BHF71_02320 [Vulcanibacillus modesticaldus]
MEFCKVEKNEIGKNALLLVLYGNDQKVISLLNDRLKTYNYKIAIGKVGSMEVQKVVSAIETAAKKNGIISEKFYREEHALYHAIIDALHGITRGQVELRSVQRTVGLRFSILRGYPYANQDEGEWIAVALYGTIGAPVKGLEHEAIGLGINHL